MLYLHGNFVIPLAENKKEAESYSNVASALNCNPSKIVFVIDAEAELVAAQKAQIGWPVMCICLGNAPLTNVGLKSLQVFLLLQLCGECLHHKITKMQLFCIQ